MLLIFTGNGKGKTTSAIGLTIRNLGHNNNITFVSFLKGMDTGESTTFDNIKSLYPNLFYKKCGNSEFIWNKPNFLDYKEAFDGFNFAVEHANDSNLIVLDELTYLLNLKIIAKDVIEQFLDNNKDKDIVITGRNVPEWLILRANLISTIEDTKHYFNDTNKAFKGLDY